MALIKCPECGWDNVSDTAESCPNCGFGIRHYVQATIDEEKKQKIRENKITKYEAEVKMPQCPCKEFSDHETLVLVSGIFLTLIAVSMAIYIATDSYFWSDAIPYILVLLGTGIIGPVMIKSAYNDRNFRFDNEKKVYDQAMRNFEEYKNNKVKEKLLLDELLERVEVKSVPNIPKCPTCGSTNIVKITTTAKAANTAAFGILGTKRHKTFHCNNCKYEW